MLDASVNGPGTSLVNLVYYFSVDALGKDNPAHVPISGNIHYLINGESIATGAGWGTTAQINAVSLNGSNSQYDSNFATVNCFKAPGSLQVCPNGSGQNRSVHLSLAVLSQEVNRISLVANANIPDGGVVDASVDPIISFDPAFDSTGFSIILSNGIGNDAASPEPSTIVLMGLGIAGCLVYRRRALSSRVFRRARH